jgi:hypothetical protein
MIFVVITVVAGDNDYIAIAGIVAIILLVLIYAAVVDDCDDHGKVVKGLVHLYIHIYIYVYTCKYTYI